MLLLFPAHPLVFVDELVLIMPLAFVLLVFAAETVGYLLYLFLKLLFEGYFYIAEPDWVVFVVVVVLGIPPLV